MGILQWNRQSCCGSSLHPLHCQSFGMHILSLTLFLSLNEQWILIQIWNFIWIFLSFQVEFVSAQGATTNHVECFWKNAKAKFKRMNGVDGEELTSYLKEFMWFKVIFFYEIWLTSHSNLNYILSIFRGMEMTHTQESSRPYHRGILLPKEHI